MNQRTTKERQKIIKKLRNKYSLVLHNALTYEEKFQLLLTPLNLITVFCVSFALVATIVIVLIVYTPVKEWIPGYPDTVIKEHALVASLKADSLERVLKTNSLYFDNIVSLLKDSISIDSVLIKNISSEEYVNYDTLSFEISKEDSMLRAKIELDDKYNINFNTEEEKLIGFSKTLFFTPIKGTVSAKFDKEKKHFGIDIVAKENESIKSALDGTVVFASWTSDSGHVIQIQHKHNIMTVYKHNSVLLKKVGDLVKAGDTIAIIGNSGEFTDGPHLHFEIWRQGIPLNPLDFIVLN